LDLGAAACVVQKPEIRRRGYGIVASAALADQSDLIQEVIPLSQAGWSRAGAINKLLLAPG